MLSSLGTLSSLFIRTFRRVYISDLLRHLINSSWGGLIQCKCYTVAYLQGKGSGKNKGMNKGRSRILKINN